MNVTPSILAKIREPAMILQVDILALVSQDSLEGIVKSILTSAPKIHVSMARARI
jgi:hypothetical protein